MTENLFLFRSTQPQGKFSQNEQAESAKMGWHLRGLTRTLLN
jgi:hypothetical protein